MPDEIHATGILNEEDVDTLVSSYFIYPHGKSAQITCSFSAPRRDSLEITCENAHLLIHSPFKPELSTGVTIISPEETTLHRWTDHQNSFIRQFDHFYQEVEQKLFPVIPLQQSCQNQQILDIILALIQ